MAISDSEKVDYLWKKLGYGATKTDTNAQKKAPTEAIPSPLLLRGDRIWVNAGDIPTVIPSSTTSIIQVYLGSSSVETTEDGTSTNNRTWKTGSLDWIPPEFGSTYQVKVYIDNPSASDPTSTGTQVFATGSGNDDEWFFDYQSGVLHFIGSNLPSSMSNSKTVYISGARYIGQLGTSGSNFDNLVANTFSAITAEIEESVTTNTVIANTITANTLVLETPLSSNSGGTGLETFVTNGVLFASNTSQLAFITGTHGKVLQINSSGEPEFNDLNGGDYS